MPLVTKLLGASPPAPNTLLWTIGTSMVVGATGLVLFRTDLWHDQPTGGGGRQHRRVHRSPGTGVVCAVVSDEANGEHTERVPWQPLLGLVLGVISGVIHPGLFLFLFPTWVIPALIALVLQISPRTRSLAVGFGAAAVGWFAYSAAFYVLAVVEAALR